MVREKTLVAPKILSGCAASMLTNANRSADGGFPKVNASGFEKRNRRLRFMAGALLMAGDDPPMAGWWQIKKTALTCSAQVLPRLFYDWLEAVAGGAGRFRGPGLSVVAATSDALVVCDCCTSPLPSPWTRGGDWSQPQTSFATSTILLSFALCSSGVSLLPGEVLAKPHCGLRPS